MSLALLSKKRELAPAGKAQHSVVREALHSPGQELDGKARKFLEPRFGHDFSQVRVHTGTKAAQAAAGVEAAAFTVGGDVVFGEGQYRPSSRDGVGLIAHELTHTIQQSSGRGEQRSSSEGALEREAGTAAREVMQGGGFRVSSRAPLMLSRQAAAAPSVDLAENASPLLAAAVGSVTIDGFETGHSEISAGNQAKLQAAATHILTFLKKYPGSTVRIVGHTDAVGTEGNNQTLGESRAASTGVALIGMGVPPGVIRTESQGAAAPLVKTKKSEPRNRRAEVRFEPVAARPGLPTPQISAAPPKPTVTIPKPSGDFCTEFPDLCVKSPPSKAGDPLPEAPGLKTPFHLMDLPGLNAPFVSHGTRPGQADDLFGNWAKLFWKYRALGLSEAIAAKLANAELSSMAGAALTREDPNVLDRSNADWSAAHPGATTVGPLMSPNLLELFQKKEEKKVPKP